MRYPTDRFREDWYNAKPFGTQDIWGFHEGADLNLRTGGDSDEGQPLKSISGPWVCTNVKSFSTIPLPPGATPNWGQKVEYKIDGPWGTRWVQMSHCKRIAVKPGDRGDNEGDFIAELGKTGVTSAHVHFAIALNQNVFDKIAKTQAELNANWEDPIKFIEKWLVTTPAPPTDIEQLKARVALLEEIVKRHSRNFEKIKTIDV